MFMHYFMGRHIVFTKHQCSSVTIHAKCGRTEKNGDHLNHPSASFPPASPLEPWPASLGVEHRPHKGLNNRAENSHPPTRRRDRIMKRFKSPRQVPRFLSTPDQIVKVFPRRRNQDTAAKLRTARRQAFTTGAEATSVAMAA